MPARRKDIPREALEELYLREELNPKEIGTRLGCSETAVRARLREYGIPLRSRSQAIRLGKGIKVERDSLVHLYHVEGLCPRGGSTPGLQRRHHP